MHNVVETAPSQSSNFLSIRKPNLYSPQVGTYSLVEDGRVGGFGRMLKVNDIEFFETAECAGRSGSGGKMRQLGWFVGNCSSWAISAM